MSLAIAETVRPGFGTDEPAMAAGIVIPLRPEALEEHPVVANFHLKPTELRALAQVGISSVVEQLDPPSYGYKDPELTDGIEANFSLGEREVAALASIGFTEVVERPNFYH